MSKTCPCPACQRERKLERYIKPLNKEAKEWIRGFAEYVRHVEHANEGLAETLTQQELGMRVDRRERRLRRRRR